MVSRKIASGSMHAVQALLQARSLEAVEAASLLALYLELDLDPWTRATLADGGSAGRPGSWQVAVAELWSFGALYFFL